jgi:hypothetical protein
MGGEDGRRPTVLRSRHLDTSHQDLDLLAERQEPRSHSVAWRREVGESAGLPVRGEVERGEDKE